MTEIVPHVNAIMPVMDVAGAVVRYQQIVAFVQQVMEPGTDFGNVPGTDKPTLLKPGAEKLCTFFGLSSTFDFITTVEDWTGADHGEPLFSYTVKCRLLRGEQLVAEGIGSCNSWERKYRYRQADRLCPKCGKPAIIKGKEEYGGGWLCFGKKGGCGAKWPDGSSDIEGQTVGLVPNADPADLLNTLQKMAQKRALVAATLVAVNASAFFTQDPEETDASAPINVTPAAASAAQAPANSMPAPSTNGKKHGPTEFWTAVTKAKFDKDTGKRILAECGGDFERATEAVLKQTPPDVQVPF